MASPTERYEFPDGWVIKRTARGYVAGRERTRSSGSRQLHGRAAWLKSVVRCGEWLLEQKLGPEARWAVEHFLEHRRAEDARALGGVMPAVAGRKAAGCQPPFHLDVLGTVVFCPVSVWFLGTAVASDGVTICLCQGRRTDGPSTFISEYLAVSL